ncbi:MAG: hypothetical protein JKY37_16435 [Nannocystaceae bacterium]|nr:hypothetical protein [Nannocystaceae bacterium]
MAAKIPTALGFISFALSAGACSDAHKLSKAFERVCKASCDCAPQTEEWDKIRNCKLACKGYADVQKAYFREQFDDEEPCDDINKLARDLKKCARKSCGDMDDCISEVSAELFECIGYDTYYDGLQTEEHPRRAILGALRAEMLYGPWPMACDSSDPERSPLCDAMGKTK